MKKENTEICNLCNERVPDTAINNHGICLECEKNMWVCPTCETRKSVDSEDLICYSCGDTFTKKEYIEKIAEMYCFQFPLLKSEKDKFIISNCIHLPFTEIQSIEYIESYYPNLVVKSKKGAKIDFDLTNKSVKVEL